MRTKIIAIRPHLYKLDRDPFGFCTPSIWGRPQRKPMPDYGQIMDYQPRGAATRVVHTSLLLCI